MSEAKRNRIINLALQGGGSHGAFTWGVCDRLLEVEDLEIDGISGCSAGGVNAAIIAHGWSVGGREGARRDLTSFWERVGHASLSSPIRRTLVDVMTGNWNLDGTAAVIAADMMQRLASPYQTNPTNYNPLRSALAATIDIQAIRNSPIKIFITATNVRTGRARVFEREDITMDAILASACLPFLFQAVEIDGDPYWDGGYTGNPSIWPLIYGCDNHDVAIVQINPLIREGTPKTPTEIINRATELSFNSNLMAEMRAIQHVESMIENGHLSGDSVNRYKKMHIHRIHAEPDMKALGVSSKMNAEIGFLHYLHGMGRLTAENWLAEHGQDIGKRSTIDIRATYL